MSEFSVQFDAIFVAPEFFSGTNPLCFDVTQSNEVNQQDLIDRQLSNELLLRHISEALTSSADSLTRYEDEISAIAFHFAETFTRTVFGDDQQLVLEKIQTHLNAGLSGIDLSAAVSVWVHPDFVAYVEEYCSQEFSNQLTIHSDPLLETSDCRIEGPESGLIARIENQLELCRHRIFESLEKGQQ